MRHGRPSALHRKRQQNSSYRTPYMRSHLLLCCSAPSRKRLICLERMQKNGRRDNSLLTKGRSSIEIQSANEKEVTLSGNHV